MGCSSVSRGRPLPESSCGNGAVAPCSQSHTSHQPRKREPR
jgi:hypothetical protein